MIRDMRSPEFKDYIKDLSSGKYGVDMSHPHARTDEVGSFRKIAE